MGINKRTTMNTTIRCCWLLLCAASFAAASTRRIEAYATSTTPTFLLPKTTSTTTTTPILPNVVPSPGAPPTGAVYRKTLPIPVIGLQSFRLHILSDRRAHLQIDGILQVDEILDYHVRPGGSFSLRLPDGLKQVLRRFRTKLVEFGYDHVTDLPYVVVSPPLPTKIRIQLMRHVDPHELD